jgi:phospholipase/carboxylesterase
MAMIDGPRFGPKAGGVPRQLVVLCHGVGSNGDDLIALAPLLAEALPHALFIAPNGPEPYGGMPGDRSRQWFSLSDRRLPVMEAGVRSATGSLDRFVDHTLAALSLPATAYVIAGFSQGAMMALFTGLRRPQAPRAILAYSGLLLGPDKLQAEMANRAPVLLVHGERDEVVPASGSKIAAEVLGRLQVPTKLILRPDLGHSIDQIGILEGVKALRAAFAAPLKA